MKKAFLLVLVVSLLASFCAVACADDIREDYDENGIILTYPESFLDIKGVFYAYPYGVDDNSGIGGAMFWYVAMPKEEYKALYEDPSKLTQEVRAEIAKRQGSLVQLISINNGRSSKDFVNDPDFEGLKEEWMFEIAKAGDMTYYGIISPESTEEYLAGIEPDFQEEFKHVQEGILEILKNGEYYRPEVVGASLLGNTLSFETTDVDGNAVKSEDIFSKNRITMINIWATWCGNCIDEMPGLNEMAKRLAEKNVGIIGICSDADTKPEECKNIIKETGVEYLNLLPFEGLTDKLAIVCYPISYFVDSEGKIIALPFKGAPPEMSSYEKVIDSLLNGETPAVEENTTIHPTDDGVYRVIVKDNNGDSVKGAYVVFCSDATCTMGKTDADGVAQFTAEKGVYTVHIQKVPDGYDMINDEIKTPETYSDVYIVLQKTN